MTISVQQTTSLLKRSQMTPAEFCEIWVPLLHGYYPGDEETKAEYGYKKACNIEIHRAVKGTTALSTISREWKWGKGEEKYPNYVPAMLSYAHTAYSIIASLGGENGISALKIVLGIK